MSIRQEDIIAHFKSNNYNLCCLRLAPDLKSTFLKYVFRTRRIKCLSEVNLDIQIADYFLFSAYPFIYVNYSVIYSVFIINTTVAQLLASHSGDPGFDISGRSSLLRFFQGYSKRRKICIPIPELRTRVMATLWPTNIQCWAKLLFYFGA